ncbi:MAG: PTS transporter subunit EIIC [Erysipelotrichaceae bacterium]|jgi:PTS system cellobiose-specific IIC component|nr:PTS transporter subunit EIIC [Erysipelotrichaceae bacterium]
MNRVLDFCERKILPIFEKLGNQRHLVAISQAFGATSPFLITASFAMLLTIFSQNFLIGNGLVAENNGILTFVILCSKTIWKAVMDLYGLAFVAALAYHLSLSYKKEVLGPILCALFSCMIFVPESTLTSLSLSYFSAVHLIPLIIITLISTTVFLFFVNHKLNINLGENIPPNVMDFFQNLLPALCTGFLFVMLKELLLIHDIDLYSFLSQYATTPLLSLSQFLPVILLNLFLVQFIWYFGLHGSTIMNILTDYIFKLPLLFNMYWFSTQQFGLTTPYIWSSSANSAFALIGGNGATLGLVLALKFFGKSEHEKQVAKQALPSSIFEINEPATFGLPVILDQDYIIPFLFTAPLCCILPYIAITQGWMPAVIMELPWITPPVLYGFLATGGSFMAVLISLVNIVFAGLFWGYFVVRKQKISVKKGEQT